MRDLIKLFWNNLSLEEKRDILGFNQCNAREILYLFGGSKKVVGLLLETIEHLNEADKENLRKAFIGEELWKKLNN